MHGILKRLASLYVLTNKHMSTPEKTICHFPVARVAWPVCSAESHRNWQRRHESLLPPWHTRDIRRQDHRKWSLIGHLELTWRCVCSFFVFCRKNLLRTRNIVMLIMPQWFRCQDRMSAHTGVGQLRRVMPVKPYFSVRSSPSEVTFLVLTLFDVSRWAVVIRLSFCLWIFTCKNL